MQKQRIAVSDIAEEGTGSVILTTKAQPCAAQEDMGWAVKHGTPLARTQDGLLRCQPAKTRETPFDLLYSSNGICTH
jgi:hypothetical protein